MRSAGTAQPTTVDGPEALPRRGRLAGRHRRACAGYTGVENVLVTTRATQAAVYAELVRARCCDPDVAEVNFFGFYDDGSRDTGFQAALHRRRRDAASRRDAVAAAIRRADARPCAAAAAWVPRRDRRRAPA